MKETMQYVARRARTMKCIPVLHHKMEERMPFFESTINLTQDPNMVLQIMEEFGITFNDGSNIVVKRQQSSISIVQTALDFAQHCATLLKSLSAKRIENLFQSGAPRRAVKVCNTVAW